MPALRGTYVLGQRQDTRGAAFSDAGAGCRVGYASQAEVQSGGSRITGPALRGKAEMLLDDQGLQERVARMETLLGGVESIENQKAKAQAGDDLCSRPHIAQEGEKAAGRGRSLLDGCRRVAPTLRRRDAPQGDLRR